MGKKDGSKVKLRPYLVGMSKVELARRQKSTQLDFKVEDMLVSNYPLNKETLMR